MCASASVEADHPYGQQTRRYSRSCLDLTRGNARCCATPSAPEAIAAVRHDACKHANKGPCLEPINIGPCLSHLVLSQVYVSQKISSPTEETSQYITETHTQASRHRPQTHQRNHTQTVGGVGEVVNSRLLPLVPMLHSRPTLAKRRGGMMRGPRFWTCEYT